MSLTGLSFNWLGLGWLRSLIYTDFASARLISNWRKALLSCRVVSMRPEAIMTRRSSCRHQWLLSDSNIGPAGYKPSALTTKPRLLHFDIPTCTRMNKQLLFITFILIFLAWSMKTSNKKHVYFYFFFILVQIHLKPALAFTYSLPGKYNSIF